MDAERLSELIESSDLDSLVRFIDGVAESADWAGLFDVIARCRDAVERGKQVWGAAHYAEYRIALNAPGPLAVQVVRPGAGRFALGPLWEVAASTHEWLDLDGVEDPTLRVLIAHERALRGDDVDASQLPDDVVDLPLGRTPWEPAYPGAVYRRDKADFPEIELPALDWVELPEAGAALDEDAAVDALLELVRPWLDESSGRGEAVSVAGRAEQAIRALGPHRVRLAQLGLDQAMGVMAWVGASGGAYGRRRGMPIGRSLAWLAAAALLGMEDDWPVDPVALGTEAGGLRWLLWEPGDVTGGWNFHLAIEDPLDGVAWAVSAVDAK